MQRSVTADDIQSLVCKHQEGTSEREKTRAPSAQDRRRQHRDDAGTKKQNKNQTGELLNAALWTQATRKLVFKTALKHSSDAEPDAKQPGYY